MTITFDQIQDRILPMRTDKKDREGQLAFMVSARRLAAETLGLQEEVLFTVTAGTVATTLVYAAAEAKECLYIFKAEWQKPDGTYEPIRLYNQEALKDLTRHTQNTPGLMKGYTSDQGRFWPNRPPSVDTVVRSIVAYKPVGDFGEVDFGHDFEDALVEGALSQFMRLPGPDKDMQLSELSEKRFQSMASSLRGVILVGDSGYARASEKPHKHAFGAFMGQDRLRY